VLFQSCRETICTFHQPEVFDGIKQDLCRTRILGREGRDRHERCRHHRLLTGWSSIRTSSLSLNISKDTESMIALDESSGRNNDTVYPEIMLLLILYLKSQQQL